MIGVIEENAERKRIKAEVATQAMLGIGPECAGVILIVLWKEGDSPPTMSAAMVIAPAATPEKVADAAMTALNNVATFVSNWVLAVMKTIGFVPRPPEPTQHAVLGGRSRHGPGRQRR